MDPLHSKAAKQLAGSASKRGGKGSARKAAGKKKKKRASPAVQNAGQSAAESPPASRGPSTSALRKGKYAGARPAAREPDLPPPQKEVEGRRRPKGRCCSLTCERILGWFGLERRRRVDDLVILDDNSGLERSLLWSEGGDRPQADDYLEFVPEHERGLMETASNASMPKPPEDRYDY